MGQKLEKLPLTDEQKRTKRKRKLIGCAIALPIVLFIALYINAMSNGLYPPNWKNLLLGVNLTYVFQWGDSSDLFESHGLGNDPWVEDYDLAMVDGKPAMAAVVNQEHVVYIQQEQGNVDLQNWQMISTGNSTDWARSIRLIDAGSTPGILFESNDHHSNSNHGHISSVNTLSYFSCSLTDPSGPNDWVSSSTGIGYWWSDSPIEAIFIEGVPVISLNDADPNYSASKKPIEFYRANSKIPQLTQDWTMHSAVETNSNFTIHTEEAMGLAVIGGKPALAITDANGTTFAQAKMPVPFFGSDWDVSQITSNVAEKKIVLVEYQGKPAAAWQSGQTHPHQTFFSWKTKFTSLWVALASVPEPQGPADWQVHQVVQGADVDNFSFAEVNGRLALVYSFETSSRMTKRHVGFLDMDYEEREYELRYALATTDSPQSATDWDVSPIAQRMRIAFNPKLEEYEGSPLVVYLADDFTTFKLARPVDGDNTDGGWDISEAINLADEEFERHLH